MSPVETVVAVMVSCDWPGCDADETFDAGRDAAVRAVRAMGWGVKVTVTGRSARCPKHKGKWLRGPWAPTTPANL